MLGGVRKNEWAFSLSMFLHFFSIIGVFWILKSLKKALFVSYYDKTGFQFLGQVFDPAQTEIFAKSINVFNSFVVMIVISVLSSFIKQKRFFILMNLFMSLLLLLTYLAFDPQSEWSVWNFYLLGDLYVMTMVPCFLAYLNDSINPDAAKRLYGLICLGGVVGGAFGSTSVRTLISHFTETQWVLLCLGISLLLLLLTQFTQTLNFEKVEVSSRRKNKETLNEQKSVFRGAKKVFASKYLAGILMLVFLYEIVSATIDFQYTSMTAALLDGIELKKHIASVYTATNWVAVLVQICITSFVLNKAGIRMALLILPFLLALGSTAFLVSPALILVSLLPILENGFNYSINQSAREVLYTIAPSRYSAKAFIDVFMNRLAKILALILSLGLSLYLADASATRWLSISTLFFLALWIFVANYLGRRFEKTEIKAAR